MIKRILVPTDFSSCSYYALSYALDIAPLLGATVTALHCYFPIMAMMPDSGVLIPNAETLADMAMQADTNMALLVKKQRSTHLTGRTAYGTANDTILEIAKEGYDLIVMGTHGRTGIKHLLLGSVAEGIVRTSPCPVLTVRENQTAQVVAFQADTAQAV